MLRAGLLLLGERESRRQDRELLATAGLCVGGEGVRGVDCDCYCWWPAVVVVHTGFMDLPGDRGGLENELYAELRVGDVCSPGTTRSAESRAGVALTYGGTHRDRCSAGLRFPGSVLRTPCWRLVVVGGVDCGCFSMFGGVVCCGADRRRFRLAPLPKGRKKSGNSPPNTDNPVPSGSNGKTTRLPAEIKLRLQIHQTRKIAPQFHRRLLLQRIRLETRVGPRTRANSARANSLRDSPAARTERYTQSPRPRNPRPHPSPRLSSGPRAPGRNPHRAWRRRHRAGYLREGRRARPPRREERAGKVPVVGAAGTWGRGYDAVVYARGGGAATVDADPGRGERWET